MAAVFIIFCVELTSSHSLNRQATCSNEENFDQFLQEDFKESKIEPCRWSLPRANWGGQKDGEDYNGGVVADAPVSFDHITLTAWTGLKPGQSTAAFRALPASIADGKFHRLMFDWRPRHKILAQSYSRSTAKRLRRLEPMFQASPQIYGLEFGFRKTGRGFPISTGRKCSWNGCGLRRTYLRGGPVHER
jgi:hypothetical protein